MTETKGGTTRRTIKRALRALAYAFAARWLQKHGIAVPEDLAFGLDELSTGFNAAALMGADKALREKWAAIKGFLFAS